MIELIMHVCLANQPTHCKEVAIQFNEDNLTPYTCVMKGQLEIAKWVQFNPQWNPMKWGCRRAGLHAKA